MIYVQTYDGHPSPRLRFIHNFNLIALIFATILSFLFFVYYVNCVGFALFAVFGMFLPIAINYTWIGVHYDHKLRSIRRYNMMIGLFVILGLLLVFQFGLVIFAAETMFTDPMSTGSSSASYQIAAMWVTENLFLITVGLVNMWQLCTFVLHVYYYREFVKEQLLLHNH